MKPIGKGILDSSDFFFHTPSSLAKELLLYCICAGEFDCVSPYHTKRAQYNSFLLMQVLEGTALVIMNQKTFRASKDDFILLNCYEPHEYYTDSNLSIRFIHFDGSLAEDFYHNIVKNTGNIFKISPDALPCKNLELLLTHYRGITILSEGEVSGILNSLLWELLNSSGSSTTSANYGTPVSNARFYILQHFQEDINLAQLASHVGLSVYHFSRIFKRETGDSPYGFILHTRIDHAKKLLKATRLNISEIGFQSGFQSSSNFVSSFHKQVGMSPGDFRRLPF